MGIGPGFECFGKFTLQIAVCSMPALLKCDLVPLVANAILDGHLPIIFGVIFELDFGPFWKPRWRDDLRVYLAFR